MPIGLFVTLRVAEGREKEFEEAFAEQAANCQKNEPGQRLYQLLRANTGERTYYVMELYDDQAALDAHSKGAHMALTRDRVRGCLEGKIEAIKGSI